MLKTVFLDRDGIVNEVVMRNGSAASPRSTAEFVIRDDFNEFYSRIRSMPLNMFVISNQPDVSRGLLDPEKLEQISDKLHSQFQFTEIIHCIHDDKDHCHCRKPKPGMITDLLDKYALNANEAIIIGDSYKDILAGKAAGIKTIYLQQSYNASVSCEPDYVVDRLIEVFSLPPFSDLS